MRKETEACQEIRVHKDLKEIRYIWLPHETPNKHKKKISMQSKSDTDLLISRVCPVLLVPPAHQDYLDLQ